MGPEGGVALRKHGLKKKKKKKEFVDQSGRSIQKK